MPEEFIVVDEPGLAELAQRVAAVRRVVGVTLATVRRELGARVVATLVSERLKTTTPTLSLAFLSHDIFKR